MEVSMTDKKHIGGIDEEMAKAIHEYYRRLCKEKGWPVKYDMDYTELPDDIEADNLAAAARIPAVLGHAGLVVVSEDYPGAAIDPKILEENIELLAEAEHNGWMEQKYRSGWVYGSPRDDMRKIHDALVPYKDLREEDKERDRNAVRSYPGIVKIAGRKIVHGK